MRVDIAPRQPGQRHDDPTLYRRLELCRDHLADHAGKDLAILYAARSALYEPAGQPLWVACAWLAGELYRLLNRFGDTIRAGLSARGVSTLAAYFPR